MLLALALCAWGAGPASAQIQGAPGQPVSLDFQDLDLAYVLSALAQSAGLNFVYHDLPSKPITLRTTTPIPRSELPELIRSLAAANGVTVAIDAGFIRMVGGGEDPDPRRLYIAKLRHARAAILGGTLQALFGGGGGGVPVAGLRPTLSQQLQQFQQGPAAVTQPVPGGFVITGGGGGGIEGNVLIVPEEVTNSLLIRATPADWAIIEQAVGTLDLRPLQVVIEVVIAEVRRTDDLDMGVSFQAIRETSGSVSVVDLPPNPSVPVNAFAVQVGLLGGNVDVSATLSALAASGEVRILSRPVVLAQNNQPARILVGSEQPFVQFSQILPNDPAGARNEVVQYREVGTVLNILPTINEDGYVNLAITQEVSNATAETQFGAPIISTREAETQLLARNGQTVVIGGLVDQQVDKVRTGIPFLKDIPILGLLFSAVRDRDSTSELFLFLTPYIVATDDDADLLRERIENERELIAPYLPVEPLTPPVVTPAPGAPTPGAPAPGAPAPGAPTPGAPAPPAPASGAPAPTPRPPTPF